MSSGPSGAKEHGGNRLGGARADFVASLGRKVQDARELVAALQDDPSSRGARDELRRKLHALGSGARLLHFDAMAQSLGEALTVLERGARAGALGEPDVAFVAQVIDDLPARAWSEPPPPEAAPPTPSGDTEAAEPATGLPIATLVLGSDELADTLTDDAAIRQRAFECERTDDPEAALELARAHAPDLVLVDADMAGAIALVEALLDDPLTEPVPIVVVGTFRLPDEAARFVALGVAKALTKPMTPDFLRGACDECLEAREGHPTRMTLGEPTLEQLADRLALALRRALVDSVEAPARSHRIPLGEGTEVLGALWGAIARVQEIVTQRTDGVIRFGGDAPEGAIALAPWLHHDVGADRRGTSAHGRAAEVRLSGRRVVVADDDPGVTWFISDLLRTAGCEVHEALDGRQALELSYRVQPELVVSDILMPELDGFALSRALRRDVALRDTPVILLSWKEDLLQRVRELGASAAAYMRKESDSRAILARVREVVRPRARIEMRLRGDGEVRGRLEGLTPRVLLDLVGSIRKNARVAVRDASYLYEIEIRDGSPRKATRTASDGGYIRGERTLASLLGVGSGRFVVASSQGPVRGELSGSLYDQLVKPIAAARGALAVTTGAGTMQVERIGIDAAVLEEYLKATPDPARSFLKRVAEGASPRQLLLAGELPPSLFEDMVSDLAARGAITLVQGPTGVDLLGPAVLAATEVLRGAPPTSDTLPPNARPSVPVGRVPMPAPRTAAVNPLPPPFQSLRPSAPPPSEPPRVDGGETTPSSLEDAVMRELSDRSPAPGAAHVGSDRAPIIEPSALRRRSSNPPAVDDAEPVSSSEERLQLISFPPDAVVPGTTSSEDIPASKRFHGGEAEIARQEAPTEVPGAVAARQDASPGAAEVQHDTDVEGSYEALLAASTQARPTSPSKAPAATQESDRTQPLAMAPGSVELAPAVQNKGQAEESAKDESTEPGQQHDLDARAPEANARDPGSAHLEPAPPPAETAQEPPTRGRGWGWWALLLAGGAVVVVVLYRGNAVPPAPAPAVSMTATPTPVAAPTPPSASPSASLAPSAAPPGETPAAADTPAGMGRIEVTAPQGARIRIDGAIAGMGPSLSLVAGPGYHDVRIEKDGMEAHSVVEVHAGSTTLVDAASTP